MSKIKNWLEKQKETLTEPHRLSKDELTMHEPDYLPPHIDRDFADKDWFRQLDKDMESDSPPF